MQHFETLYDFLSDFQGMTRTEQEFCKKIILIIYDGNHGMKEPTEPPKLIKVKKPKKKRKNNKIVVHCEWCGKKVRTYNPYRKFCSHKCQGKSRAGVPKGPYNKKIPRYKHR